MDLPEDVKKLPVRSQPTDEKSHIACLVKCDRSLPHCTNCVRLGLNCPGYDAETQSKSRSELQKSAENIFKASGVEKRRVGSCSECRSSKHRCTRTRPSCRRCDVKGLACVYPDRPESNRFHGQPQVFPGGSEFQQFQVLNPIGDFEADRDLYHAQNLPEQPSLRLKLVTAFFDRSYHLRCLDFIDRQNFMESFERDSIIQDFGEPVLLAVCALGARHLYLDYLFSIGSTAPAPDVFPGQPWAEKARNEVLSEMNNPTAMVLLCDYSLRTDQNSLAFILVSFLYRVIRLLGLDESDELLHSHDPTFTLQRNIENRLVWACFFIDLFMATAGEKNTSWGNRVPNIPLPTQQSYRSIGSPNFYLSDIETVGVMQMTPNLDLSGIVLMTVRLRINGLHLIRKQPQSLSVNICDPSSAFIKIIQQVETIYRLLPRHLRLDDDNIYNLKRNQSLGGVFFLHFLIHAAIFDLTRVSLPGFAFPIARAFQSVSTEFSSYCQQRCRFHAARATDLVRKGLQHGRTPFDDIFTADAALEAIKILIIYNATVDPSPDTSRQTWEDVQTTLQFFDLFHSSKDGPKSYMGTLLPLCYIFGFRDAAEPYRTKDLVSFNEDPAEVTGPAEVEHLSQFAPFRRARTSIKRSQSAAGSKTPSSQNEQLSLVMQPLPGLLDTSMSPVGNEPQPPPFNLQPDYPPFAAQPSGISMPLYRSQNAQTMVTLGSITHPSETPAIPQSSMTMGDYIRAADEMSGFLTWQTSDLPPWFTYDNPFPPGYS
ncbi:unnamed protein product [Clonostachys rosea]|uniref:Zn(2)-C6 fungal-type domain-containing protein n=1 Tax=Bionectria ochroleuca TaxID=29856 RepID=A0ABY6TQM1_BIOOC|nr:unnamed protein product [Clonostachys rosea]